MDVLRLALKALLWGQRSSDWSRETVKKSCVGDRPAYIIIFNEISEATLAVRV